MRRAAQLSDVPSDVPLALAIGAFDGLHLGHQAILQTAREEARVLNGEAWVLTFSPHPAQLLRPDQAPPLLCTDTQRDRILESNGMDGRILLPFTRELANQSPDAFWQFLRRGLPPLAAVIVGENWRFGRKAAGHVETLRQFGAADHILIRIPEVRMEGEEPISSTRIRHAVQQGDMEIAQRMLGRPYAVEGPVIHGRKVGRRMNFPTINIDVQNQCMPAPGVYAVQVAVDGNAYKGAGYRAPGGNRSLFEVHLLDFAGDLYGKTVEASLLRQMRGPIPHADIADLPARIQADVDNVRSYFS